MSIAIETLSDAEKKFCVMLFLKLITPEQTYTITVLHDIHDLHKNAVVTVEQDPILYPYVLQEFGDTAQIITVLDWDEQW